MNQDSQDQHISLIPLQVDWLSSFDDVSLEVSSETLWIYKETPKGGNSLLKTNSK